MFCRVPQWSHLVLNFCLWGVFIIITDSISLLVLSLFKFSVSYWLNYGRLYVFKNLFISSWLSSSLAYNCYFSSVINFFLNLCAVYFLFCELGQMIVDFLYPFKEPTLSFIDFSSSLSLFYFLSGIYYFLPSSDFRFCLFYFF